MPTWVEEFYGPQPEPGTHWAVWRQHPGLRGRFHPECPDDLQVVVHDGGPRMSTHPPELVWIRVNGVEADVFRGQLLNQPHNLKSVRVGDTIQFLVPTGGKHLLMVTEKYLRERANWIVRPCNKCGLSELFDCAFRSDQQDLSGHSSRCEAGHVHDVLCALRRSSRSRAERLQRQRRSTRARPGDT